MRQFVINCNPTSDNLIYLKEKDFKYIRQVLRLNVGDMIKVVYKEEPFDATICKIDETQKEVVLQLCDTVTNDKNNFLSNTEFCLLQFIPKPQKMELIIRQAVECGIKTVIPVIGEYTQKGTETFLAKKQNSTKEKNARLDKTDRIARIIKEARQQSGSMIDTNVLAPCTLTEAISIIKEKSNEIKNTSSKNSIFTVLYEKNEDSVSLHEVAKIDDIAFAVIAVGCEGGISPKEIELLKQNGFETIHFDTNILRCETASLYGIASLQTILMEKQKWKSKE